MSALFFKKVTKLPKKYFIIGILIIVLVVRFLPGSRAAEKFEFAKVEKQDISSSVSASGVLTGKNTVNLGFLQGGKLAFINVQKGERVTQWQTIAGLDTQALNIELQQAQNTLRDKQATAEKVLDDIHLFQYGNGGFDNVGSLNETMTQRQLRTTAEVARDNAFDSIRSVQRDFQDKFIVAPFGGIITQINAFPGQLIGGSVVVAQLVDDSQVFFDADVDEADIGKVEIGQKALVTLDAYPDKTFSGTVSEISPQAKVASTQATVVTVRILFDSAKEVIFGLQGQASIVTEQTSNALTIPLEAVRPDNTAVIRSAGGLQPVKIKTAIQSDTGIQVMEGLKEGQEVLLNPPSTLPRRQQNVFQRLLRPLTGGTFKGR